MSEHAILTFVFAFSGALMIAISVPLIRRSVKPNPLYGLRVAATFADESVWYEANARSGRDFLILGTVLLMLAIGLRLVPISQEAYAFVNGGVLIAGTLLNALIGWRRANRLLATKVSADHQAAV